MAADDELTAEAINGAWLQRLDERTKAHDAELVAVRVQMVAAFVLLAFVLGVAIRGAPRTPQGGRP